MGDANDYVLTAEDVRNQVFTTVRLREGYDLAEVDVFLGMVETSLTRLHREYERLKARCDLGGIPAPTWPGAAEVIASAQRQAEAIVAEAEARARDVELELRERLRRAAEILAITEQEHARDLENRRQQADRRRADIQDHLSWINEFVAGRP
ncbi:hypothetical protein Aph01nite_54630 [Acrocarpospora phusangensis]|uniref:Cell wall synthesis protein Wag31 n=1 Tax=Acrocarpospora phusangensis TaxID=1070424 RepID=A0A919UR72_9ACTN|nr:DivIVA domain-containing protein [Acrocarpospora phusangensis]GIH27153.1 hypothetical protein Aph01nite_54630 [Acrocarpospora phusangensis]